MLELPLYHHQSLMFLKLILRLQHELIIHLDQHPIISERHHVNISQQARAHEDNQHEITGQPGEVGVGHRVELPSEPTHREAEQDEGGQTVAAKRDQQRRATEEQPAAETKKGGEGVIGLGERHADNLGQADRLKQQGRFTAERPIHAPPRRHAPRPSGRCGLARYGPPTSPRRSPYYRSP